jgi:hypothetical protein
MNEYAMDLKGIDPMTKEYPNGKRLKVVPIAAAVIGALFAVIFGLDSKTSQTISTVIEDLLDQEQQPND